MTEPTTEQVAAELCEHAGVGKSCAWCRDGAAAVQALYAPVLAENEALKRRLFPDQGASYANEVERQRYAIDELQRIARERIAEVERLRAQVQRVEALADESDDDAQRLARAAAVVFTVDLRAALAGPDGKGGQ